MASAMSDDPLDRETRDLAIRTAQALASHAEEIHGALRRQDADRNALHDTLSTRITAYHAETSARLVEVRDENRRDHAALSANLEKLAAEFHNFPWKIIGWLGIVIAFGVAVIGYLITKGVPWAQ